MRTLSTGLVAALSSIVIGLPACAETIENADTHPILGKKPPLEVLNKDILALPERERQAFIHGAMVQMVSDLAARNPKGGKCVTEWYFEVGNGVEVVPLAMKKYPDYAAVAALHALAKRACPSLSE